MLEPPLMILIAQKLWEIEEQESRKAAILNYIAIGYTDWKVTGVDKPYVKCERKGQF